MEDWDDLIQTKIKSIYKENWIYCDIGSCVGEYINFFKKLYPSKIYSFEANPNNHNSIMNLDDDICVYENVAVSDINGFEKIYFSSGSSGDHLSNILGHDTSYNKMENFSEVKAIKLDTYFRKIKPDCLKVDVEGSELKVIKGGIKTIKNSKFCIIECHLDEDWNEIYDILALNKLEFRNLLTNDIIDRDNRPYQIFYKNDKL